jgi:hypothetical protein
MDKITQTQRLALQNYYLGLMELRRAAEGLARLRDEVLDTGVDLAKGGDVVHVEDQIHEALVEAHAIRILPPVDEDVWNEREDPEGDEFDGAEEGNETECYCHDGHKQNDTVCMYCYRQGRRKWNDPEVP